MDKPIFLKIPYGIFLITTSNKDTLGGCIANTVIQITDFPTNLVVSLNKKSHTAELMLESKKCIIGLITENFDVNIITHFSSHTGHTENKFDRKYSDIFTYKMRDNMPCLDKNLVCNLICTVKEVVDADTHYLFVLTLNDVMEISKEDKIMNYNMYMDKKAVVQAVKAEENERKAEEAPEHARTNFVCTVCSYIYDQPTQFEKLPDDYKCPICGSSKDFFIETYLTL